MRNTTTTIVLNLLYWFIYLVLFSFYYNSVNYPKYVYFPVLPDHEIFSFTGAFVLVPGVFAFYSGYTLLFNILMVRRRSLQFAGATAMVLLLSHGIMVLLDQFPGKFSAELNFSATPAFLLHYGTGIVFLALVNCLAGIVMRGFLSWLALRPNREGLSAKSVS